MASGRNWRRDRRYSCSYEVSFSGAIQSGGSDDVDEEEQDAAEITQPEWFEANSVALSQARGRSGEPLHTLVAGGTNR
jgi:hypothetical protein